MKPTARSSMLSQVVTIDKGRLGEVVGRLTLAQLEAFDNGLRLALDLAI